MISKLLLPLIAGVTVFAQNPGLPDLKAVLELSDAQIQSLGLLEQQKGQAVQPIAQRMQQTQQQLEKLLQGSSPDPAAAGRLIIEVATFGRQVQQIITSLRQQALNLLQPAQKTKLQSLSQVLVLQLAAQQAASLGLLSPPSFAPPAAGEPDPQ